ncbi:MAG: helix-turn-helix domain-containing protein [Eubacteriales bacterium]|nr:helix-turn-helix domain-containing protein [Eubacteriales bacterium]
MHTILIVDDEDRDVHMLRMLLEYQWGEEFHIVTASGALEALTEIQEFHPTLLFVDIQMPQMDGLSFLKLLEENPDVYCVVVSAHNDFSYTKGAIVAGARDYLLKPVQLPDLSSSVSKYFHWYQNHEQELKKKKNADRRIRHLSTMLEKDIIYSIMRDQKAACSDLLNDYLLMSGVVYDWGCCTAFGIRPDKSQSGESVQVYEKVSRLRPALRSRMHQKGIRIISAIINDTFIVYFFFHHRHHEECLLELRKITSSLAREASSALGHEISYAIGTEFASNEGLSASFRSCIDKLRRPVSDADTVRIPSEALPHPALQHIIQHIRAQSTDAAGSLFQSYVRSEEARLPSGFAQETTADALSYIERLLTGQPPARDFRALLTGLSGETLVEQSGLLLAGIADAYISQTQKRQHQTITQICAYIQEKYDRQLTLSGLSHRFHINSYYLSKLFKQYTDQNFVDYLTGIRIQKAMELIRHGDFSVKEIAGKVGYNDQSYFSKVFKKITGMNPSEYRNSQISQP